jgi:protein phosphatase PTC2/3
VLICVDRKCYIANVGDSRALLSSHRGTQITSLSQDHKPELSVEKKRIRENGGNIYQSYIKTSNSSNETFNLIFGPFRVFPGKLSVSRTIGDADAKMTRFGGNPNCVICKPDVKEINIGENDDFILLGCDGIFDKMKNKEII